MASKPVAAELVWSHDFQFHGASAAVQLLIDGDSAAGPSPVQLLVFGLASCMAIDVLDIVQKGRHRVEALRVSLSGERAADPPRRLLSVAIRFEIRGDVTPAAVARAIALSRDRYCSVWHSLRQDIRLETSFDIAPPGTGSGRAPQPAEP